MEFLPRQVAFPSFQKQRPESLRPLRSSASPVCSHKTAKENILGNAAGHDEETGGKFLCAAFHQLNFLFGQAVKVVNEGVYLLVGCGDCVLQRVPL